MLNIKFVLGGLVIKMNIGGENNWIGRCNY